MEQSPSSIMILNDSSEYFYNQNTDRQRMRVEVREDLLSGAPAPRTPLNQTDNQVRQKVIESIRIAPIMFFKSLITCKWGIVLTNLSQIGPYSNEWYWQSFISPFTLFGATIVVPKRGKEASAQP